MPSSCFDAELHEGGELREGGALREGGDSGLLARDEAAA